MKQSTLFTDLSSQTGAMFSDCRRYRYLLWRHWNETKPKVMFIGLNPSTANENKNDATIRRVISFAKAWGYGGVYMANCFPFISTNPKDLEAKGNNVHNDYVLDLCGSDCKEIVFAWGAFKIVKALGRDLELFNMYPNAKCLGFNTNGSPKHPLFVAGNTSLVLFSK